MTRYGPPDDSGYYAEDPYGQGDPRRVPPPQEERTPWYRTPGAIFAAGVLATLLLVFIVWAILQTGSDDVTGAGDAPLTPITPTATTPATTTTAPPAERATETVTVTETSAVPPVTSTITESPTSVSTTTSTTVETTVSTTVSTTTVTVTETASPQE